MFLDEFAGSLRDDTHYREWFAKLERLSARLRAPEGIEIVRYDSATSHDRSVDASSMAPGNSRMTASMTTSAGSSPPVNT